MIPHEYIEEVVRRNDVSEVIGSYVQLKRKGRLHSGLCPFHAEKSPSFYVYPDTQSFYCFGCGAGGDVISFTKKINNIDYLEAVKLLAGRAGMPEPSEDDKVGRMRSRVLSINRDAARYFHLCLNSSTDEACAARAYWRRRGLDDKTIKRFGLGYAPDDFRAMHLYLRQLGYKDEELLESGLVKRSEKGNIYNVFRHRIMTPIFDLRGNVIAFGGRVMDDSKPKYINSPETLVYKKSKTLFAMQIAKKSASKRFVLCEGYMDVISMQQAGIDTAVCACGTALTAEQVKLLADYAEEVILCYDSDEAGQKATTRSLGLLKNTALRIGVLQIPDAKDPDEYIKKYGAERFQKLLDNTGNALEFKLGQIRQNYDIAEDKERIEYVSAVVQLLAQRYSPTEREVYAGRVSEETGVSKTAILAQIAQAVRRNTARQNTMSQRDLLREGVAQQTKVPYAAGGQKALGIAMAEQMLVVAVLRNVDYAPFVLEHLDVSRLIMPVVKEAFAVFAAFRAENIAISLASIGTRVREETRNELSRLVAEYSEVNPTKQDVEMYLDRIAHSTPKSAVAAQMSDTELVEYMQKLKEKKGVPPQTV